VPPLAPQAVRDAITEEGGEGVGHEVACDEGRQQFGLADPEDFLNQRLEESALFHVRGADIIEHEEGVEAREREGLSAADGIHEAGAELRPKDKAAFTGTPVSATAARGSVVEAAGHGRRLPGPRAPEQDQRPAGLDIASNEILRQLVNAARKASWAAWPASWRACDSAIQPG
jgi:hypothetical protein